MNKIDSTGCKWSSLNAPRHWTPSMKVKSWKKFRTKLAQLAANDLVWMLQALSTKYESQKSEKIRNKSGSTGCKWSSLNSPLLLYLLIYSPNQYNQPKAILIYSFYSIYSFTLHIYTTTPKPFTFTPFTLFTHLLSISLSHNQSHSSSSFTTFTLFTHLPSTIPHTLMSH